MRQFRNNSVFLRLVIETQQKKIHLQFFGGFFKEHNNPFLFEKILCKHFHSVEITEIYSHIFDKNFVKATFYKVTSWFHEIFFRWEWISRLSTLWNVIAKCLFTNLWLLQSFTFPTPSAIFWTLISSSTYLF